MILSSIQGHKLEITVVGCVELTDIGYGRHETSVALMYDTTAYQTKSSTDGGESPSFDETFEFSLIEGHHEIIVVVCTGLTDSSIRIGKVKIDKIFREGHKSTMVPLQSSTRRQAGKVGLILHYYPNPDESLDSLISSLYITYPVDQHLSSARLRQKNLSDMRVEMADAQSRRYEEGLDRMGKM